MGKVTIQVEEHDLERIEDRVTRLVAEHIVKISGDKLTIEAQKIAQATLSASVEERVKQATDDVLENGWPVVTSWGEQTGKMWTLRQHIVDMLERVEGQYEKRSKLIDRVVKEAVEHKLNVEFASVFAEARERFRAAVEGIVKEKLAETLKSALGLR